MTGGSHLVLLGAGHAHLRILHALRTLTSSGVSVTVVDQREHLYYSGMMPAVLGGRVAPKAAKIPVRKLTETLGGHFVHAMVEGFDAPAGKVYLSNGEIVGADVFSLAMGSRVDPPIPVDPDANVKAAKPVADLEALPSVINALQSSLNARVPKVSFVGGGPSAVELAGNLVSALGSQVEATVVARGTRLLSRMPERAGIIAEESLVRRGVVVHRGRAAVAVRSGKVELSDGASITSDLVVLTTGLSAPAIIGDSGLDVDPSGAMRVGSDLRVPSLPVFGGGDCIAIEAMPLERIGVHAVRQSEVLLENLQAELGIGKAKKRLHYKPPKHPLLIINLGDGSGIIVRGQEVRRGKMWMLLKERIDWNFVRSKGASILPSFFSPPRPPG